jgi:hypothetical protein
MVAVIVYWHTPFAIVILEHKRIVHADPGTSFRRHKRHTLGYQPLGCHSHNGLAVIMAIEHPDECFGRFLKMVYDVLAITDATVGDPRSNLAQECGIVLLGKVVVDEAAQRQAFR